MTGHNRATWVLQLVVGFAAGMSGASAVSCTTEAPRAVCEKQMRSCAAPSHDEACDEADECIPAEALGGDALTDCEDGRCVWDCSAGEACPDGWRCVEQSRTLGELISGC